MLSLKVSQALFSGLGGHASVVFSILDADKNEKWTNDLLFYGVEELNPAYIKRCKDKKISYSYIQKKNGNDLYAFKQVYQYWQTIKPDVILLHSPSILLVAWWYCLWHNCRLILVEHTPNQVKRKSEWLWSWLGMLMAQRIVLLTQEYFQEFSDKMGIWFKKRKVSIIPNGIDVNYFKPKEGPKKKLFISMVARFSETKGQALLLQAFSILKGRGLGAELELVLAGDGETLTTVKKICHQLQLEDTVRFPGLLNEEDIKALLQQTTIYVHITYGETMSTSIMQALACGLPVIASDIPGVYNLVRPESGVVVKNDPSAIANILEQILSDSEMQVKLGGKARRFAEMNLGQDLMFNRYDALVQSKKLIS